jgi:hypothetical protein
MNRNIKALVVAAGLAIAAIGTTAATAAPADAKGAIVIKFGGGKKFGYYKGYKGYHGHYGHYGHKRHCKPVFRYVYRFGHWRKKFVGWKCFPRYRYGYGY